MIKIILIFALGAFSALSMAPANFWPALFIGLSGLYICVAKTNSAKIASLYAAAFTFAYFTFSLSWIGNALLVEDNPYWWAWPLAVTGLPFILCLFFATTVYIHKKISKNEINLTSFISFIAAIFTADYARGNLFTGFPWNSFAQTWSETPLLMQTAALSDMYLLTLLTIIWATTPAYIYMCKYKTKYVVATITILSLTACLIYGHNRINNYQPFDDAQENAQTITTIVQPNIKQNEKWKPENRVKNFYTLLNLSKIENTNVKAGKTHVIIWPETAISQDLINTQWVRDEIASTLQNYQLPTYLVTGALRYNAQNETYHNSIITFDNNGQIISTYNKSHLVPFGEYIPFKEIIDIAPVVGFTGFEKGTEPKEQIIEGIFNFYALICYEAIFPQQKLEKNNVKNNTINAIINVTNDAWYGDSAGPYQHLAQTKFRAIETGIPTLRSANTGISTITSPTGEVLYHIPLTSQGVISAPLLKNIDKTQIKNYTNLATILLIYLLVLYEQIRAILKKIRN